jgi:hypothetical protein
LSCFACSKVCWVYFSTAPEVFIYNQKEVLVREQTLPCLANRKSKAKHWSKTILAGN